ncbi:MAG: hypothetical protein WC989_03515 [Micavibrio sp.]
MKIAAGMIVLLAVIACGIAVGSFMRAYQGGDDGLRRAAPPQAENSGNGQPSFNPNIYDVSPPNRGAHSTLLPVTLTRDGGGMTATARLGAEEGALVGLARPVILYKENGVQINILGEVVAIDREDGGSGFIVTVGLTDDDHAAGSKAVRGDIVVARDSAAQRLPLSVLVKDAGGDEFLWEAVKDSGGQSKAVRHRANILARTYDYVVIHQPDMVSNVYILNPDSALEDGQEIYTNLKHYSAPKETPDARIAREVDERTPRDITDPYRGPPIEIECAAEREAAAAGAGAGGGTACASGATGDALQDFINKIRSGNRPANP